jgi:hypothetical protein
MESSSRSSFLTVHPEDISHAPKCIHVPVKGSAGIFASGTYKKQLCEGKENSKPNENEDEIKMKNKQLPPSRPTLDGEKSRKTIGTLPM